MAVKQAIVKLETLRQAQGKRFLRKNLVAVTGIGCHGKMYDYLNTNAFYSLHGRSLPIMLGIKLANPELKVVGFVGDGDMYAEGMEHLIHNCRYNSDMTVVVHNNQTFALTTGQTAPTSDKSRFRTNPVLLALEAGATFVGRAYGPETAQLTDLLAAAMTHRGFSLVEVILPCLAFHNNTDFLKEKVYRVKPGREADFKAALEKAREWDYSNDGDDKIPIGIYYQTNRPTFEEQWRGIKGRGLSVDQIVEKFK